MSLTNPNKVITEERLNEYHNTILPYLGGMPEILANKFSKSDLYSTDEKMIGQWVDGKPIYQKTFVGNAVPSDTTVFVSNVDTVVNAWGIQVYSSSNSAFYFPYVDGNLIVRWQLSSNNISFMHRGSDTTALTNYRYTFQYTKTTDSAISIGNDTDYSTTEKIVGTWIDGKPVYQKTVDCGALPNNTVKTVSAGITNPDKVIRLDGISQASNNILSLPQVYPSDLKTYDVSLSYHPQTDEIELICRQDRSMFSAYVTIQYTKTS